MQTKAILLDTEVLIAGAGPAGSFAAMHLQQKGIPHLLVDKAQFPRDKVCGDALSGKVVQQLKRFDPTILDELDQRDLTVPSWGVKFASPGGHAVDIPFFSDGKRPDQAPGYIATRLQFDEFLFKHAVKRGSPVREQTEIQQAVYQNGYWQVHAVSNGVPVEIRAKLVIAADGDRSVFKKQFPEHQLDPSHYCGGVRAYYTGVTGMHPENYIELHFIKELLPGYLWIFPLPGGRANIGAGMLSSNLAAGKVNLREKMLKALETNPTIRERFRHAQLEGKVQGWGLPLGSKKRPLSADGLILTGDAASLIDPFTGEGIGNAMLSAASAADFAARAIKDKRTDAAFLKAYDEEIYRKLWAELKLSHTLQRLCNQQWLFDFVVKKAIRNTTFRETISCMFEDLDMRARFRQPGFYFRLLFNRGN